MERPHNTLFDLQALTVGLTHVERNHFIAGTDKRENDIEHSFTVALLCWYIVEENELDLDMAKVLKYAMAHDFPERYAGDVNTFASDQERKDKLLREEIARQRLSGEFSGFPGLIKVIFEYEERQDEESLFVWTVDKMQALIMGELDNWRPYQQLEITYEMFVDKYQTTIETGSPHCQAIFETVVDYCKTTYYDRPT